MSVVSRDAPKYYWDACVFLSYVEGTPDRAPDIHDLLQRADDGELEIFTSIASIAEVAFAKMEKDERELSTEIQEKIDKLWVPPSPVLLLEIHDGIVRSARELMRRSLAARTRIIKPMDAIHLATAMDMEVKEFHTYEGEDRLGKAESFVPFKICQPPKFTGKLFTS